MYQKICRIINCLNRSIMMEILIQLLQLIFLQKQIQYNIQIYLNVGNPATGIKKTQIQNQIHKKELKSIENLIFYLYDLQCIGHLQNKKDTFKVRIIEKSQKIIWRVTSKIQKYVYLSESQPKCYIRIDKQQQFVLLRLFNYQIYGRIKASQLQIDFMANLTLIDHKLPLVPKMFYFKRSQCAKMIIRENNKLNMLEFQPDILGKDCYQSDSIKMSKLYYKKLQQYISYLFKKYKSDLQEKQKKLGTFIFQQLFNKDKAYMSQTVLKMEEARIDKLDGLPQKCQS